MFQIRGRNSPKISLPIIIDEGGLGDHHDTGTPTMKQGVTLIRDPLFFIFRPGEYPAPWGEGFSPLWSFVFGKIEDRVSLRSEGTWLFRGKVIELTPIGVQHRIVIHSL